MTKKIEVAGNNPQNTFDRLAGNQKAFSVSNYADIETELQSHILAIIKPSKEVRLQRHCFYCGKSYTDKMMSNAVVSCKRCYAAATAKDKSKIARSNLVEKTLNNIHKFLRRRVAV